MSISIQQLGAIGTALFLMLIATSSAPAGAQAMGPPGAAGGAQMSSSGAGMSMNTPGGPAGAIGLQGVRTVSPGGFSGTPGFGSSVGTSFGFAYGFNPFFTYAVPEEMDDTQRPTVTQEPTTFGTMPQQKGQNVNYMQEWNQSQSGFARVIPRAEIREW